MTFIQRLGVFVIGIVLGSILAGYLMNQRRQAATQNQRIEAEVAPQGVEAMQRAAVPGIMRAYNERQVPMQSEFVKSEWFSKDGAPEQMVWRFLLLRGREADQLLGLREQLDRDGDRVWGKVHDVRIFAADRVVVRAAQGVSREQFAAVLEPLQMHIVRGLAGNADADPSAPLEVRVGERVRMETPADVADSNLYLVGFAPESAQSVASALAALKALPQVEFAALDYLDAGNRYQPTAR